MKKFNEIFQSEIDEIPHNTKDEDEILESEIFETRHDFRRLCQEHHCQYDTQRHAKHSTMMVLYYLHNPTAPAFRDICYLDIEASQGWRCEVCADYEVFNACYQKDGVDHSHKLTNHPSSAEHDAQNKEARQALDLLVETEKKIRDAERYPINQTDKHKLFQGYQCEVYTDLAEAEVKKEIFLLHGAIIILLAAILSKAACHLPASLSRLITSITVI
ncbi:hypothetical protein FXO37_05231 [Capsicum annuum]|nr:hypothetical protein FXO37_05231 [Capsicum annuum]